MKTISRALKLLKIIAGQPLRVQEVADEMDIHKSSASRLLSTLQKENFVQLNDERRYELGYAVFELAHIFRDSLDLRKVARPYLEKINNLTCETIHLAVPDDHEVVYIDKLDAKRSVRMRSLVGKRAKLYCTGVGKAILAFLPDEAKNNILDKVNLVKYTDNTITSKDNLVKELTGIHDHYLAWDNGEHEEDIYCIAAPIFDFSNKVIASISVSASIKYTPVSTLALYQTPLRENAMLISRKLGYTGDYLITSSQE
jgi:IclR family KDG regulon transcriptional repressor